MAETSPGGKTHVKLLPGMGNWRPGVMRRGKMLPESMTQKKDSQNL